MRKLVIFIAIIIGVLFSGCSDSPENIAKENVLNWADGEIEDVKKVLSQSALQRVESAKMACALKGMNIGFGSRNTNNKILKVIFEEKKINEIFKNKELNEKIKKLTSSEDLTDEEKKEKFIDLVSEQFDDSEVSKNILEFISRASTYKVKPPREEIAKLEKNIIDAYLKDKKEKCEIEVFSMPNLDEVNVVDLVEISPDLVDVKLEIVFKDGKSTKYNTSMELINKEWKINDSFNLINLKTNSLF